MAAFVSYLPLLLLAAAATAADYEARFEAWCAEHGRSYATPGERAARLAAFADNAAFLVSFSATGAMEGINKIKTGSLISLSEQELIDCDRSYNSGCGGGLMDYAYKFVVKNGGIDTEQDYPYRETDGTCNKNKLKRRVVTIDGYKDVPANNEDLLLQAVAQQPVSVGICGSARAFQLYSKGIFDGPCPTSLDHAVLIVGYGFEGGKDYWIVKNSWGESWGMKGYMHMRRNAGNSYGICGINQMPSFPTKTSPNPPPSPGPGPTKCSLLTYCPEGSTCCCSWRLLGFCLSWSCCELDSAVCCKDNRYCCPHDYPICDTASKRCFKANNGNFSVMEEGSRKQSFSKVPSWGVIFPSEGADDWCSSPTSSSQRNPSSTWTKWDRTFFIQRPRVALSVSQIAEVGAVSSARGKKSMAPDSRQ
uniref:Granulins domain-containing protein n=1 Tax=Leersia perrieri TaxID=77586 RepID=A0A0D9WIE7_9ORYZ